MPNNPTYEELQQRILELEQALDDHQQAIDLSGQKEDSFRMLFENMTTGFVLFEVVLDDKKTPIDLVILAANKAFEITTGLDVEAVLNKRLTRVLPGIENDAADWIGTYGEVALTGESKNFEQGSELLGYYYFVRAYQAAPGLAAVLFTDITENKKNQIALKESEVKFKNIFHHSPLGKSITGVDGSLQVNQAFCDILGYTDEELQNSNWKDLTHPEDIDHSEQVVKELLDDLHNSARYEKRYIHKDGHIVWAEVTTSLLRDEQETPLFFITAIQDITEKKKLEEDRLRFYLLAESSSDFIGMCDLNLIPNYVNPAGRHMVGLPDLEAACRVKVPDYFFEEDQRFMAEEFFQNVLRDGHGDVEIRLRHFQTGEAIWVFYYLYHVKDANGNVIGWATVSRNITEQKIQDEKQTALESQLRQSQKLESIGTLAGGVAHEINNPINGIMNYAQLINDRLDPDNPLREYAEEIGKETRRVAGIVSNLLSFARQDKQAHSPANLADIVNNTTSLIGTIIKKDQIELKIVIPDNLPQLKCRSQQIQQVLMNLLTNARDALNERYPDPDPDKIISLTVKQFKKGGRRWLRTSIEDHGSGITGETETRLFDPFYTTKDRSKGTGLGLSISLGLVQDHHGEITFESKPNRFTRFHLDLPIDNGWELS